MRKAGAGRQTHRLHNSVAQVALSPYGDRTTAKRIAGLLPVANVSFWPSLPRPVPLGSQPFTSARNLLVPRAQSEC
jgi:hypothetical protein